jgi:hypothetical protein
MEKYLPIIYVRGYAGSRGAVESTVDRPYYGFNLGSTQVRIGPDGDPGFFIFESPLVRLLKDHGSALTVPAQSLETGCETLFRTFLMKAYRPSPRDRYSNFQIRLRILPLFVRNRRVLRDCHYFGEHLFQHTLTVGIRDSDTGDGRLVRARWAGLDSDLPATGKRYPRNDNIRFPLPSKNLA